MCNIVNKYFSITKFINWLGAPLFALALRAVIFKDFFTSGWLKFNYVLHDQWDTVVYLFTEEYKVPFLSPEWAGALTIFTELTFAALILIGLGTRISGLMILIMSLIIELTYGHALTHYIWMICATYLLLYGPGVLSLDCLIEKRMR